MKEDKIFYGIALAILVVISYVALFGNSLDKNSYGTYHQVKYTAPNVGLSANVQWQNAMAWTRENTSEDAIFVHWWDYGYFVQTLGERRTVTDGGHSGGGDADHYIGRYILTTPNPKTALSFMKTWNVSYLLIDPTETGKYGAFSKIGSNDSWDRVSTGVASGEADIAQDIETSGGITRIYQVGACVDSDVNYGGNFIPGISVSKTQTMQCKASMAGIIINMSKNGENITIGQPNAVFIYNGKQVAIPMKYLYINGQMREFEQGIEAVAYIVPAVVPATNGGVSLDRTGGIIYLSPLVFDSLMGRLYVLDDYYNEYPTLSVANSQDDEVVNFAKNSFGVSDDFIYYQGLHAPLKIWKVDYPEGVETHNEFFDSYRKEFNFGGLDYLFR